MTTAGAIYDINGSYTDVFIVVGCVYIVATLVFGAIPVLQYLRQGSSTVDEMNGATKFETFRISTKRSTSRGSIANGLDAAVAAPPLPPPPAAPAVDSYGAIAPAGNVDFTGGHGYGYGSGGGVPDWNGSRSGSGQMSSPPPYGSLQ